MYFIILNAMIDLEIIREIPAIQYPIWIISPIDTQIHVKIPDLRECVTAFLTVNIKSGPGLMIPSNVINDIEHISDRYSIFVFVLYLIKRYIIYYYLIIVNFDNFWLFQHLLNLFLFT